MKSLVFTIHKMISVTMVHAVETDSGDNQAPRFAGYSHLRFPCLILIAIAFVFNGSLFAQRLAVLSPEPSSQTQEYASRLVDSLSKKFKILDDSMSEAAYRSVIIDTPFNLTVHQAKAIADVVGCDYFVLLRSGTLRRSSFAKAEYYESFVSAFVVNGRSGSLVYWALKSFEADKPSESKHLLLVSSETFANEINQRIATDRKYGLTAENVKPIEEVPTADSPKARNFRPPMPYARIKPEYTRKAYLYDVRATVDAVVDIDQTGAVAAVSIERWAGFDLDESVIETIHKMNWRPATRNGKTLAMRVLLRYNFTKIEKE